MSRLHLYFVAHVKLDSILLDLESLDLNIHNIFSVVLDQINTRSLKSLGSEK